MVTISNRSKSKRNFSIKKVQKFLKKHKKRCLLTFSMFLVATICFTLFYTYWDYKTNYVKSLSQKGLELLNEYEFPWYMVEEDEEGFCISPYDVGDNVITFGAGVTYETKEKGIIDINERFNKNYSEENDCIDINILFDLQVQEMVIYEQYVIKFLYQNKLVLQQNQFDALVIMAYNSPDFLKDEGVIAMLKSDVTQEDYIKEIDEYYQKLNSYYDNPYTEEENDGYGEGWYNRIVDSSEVYFFSEYQFQNNA